jgi:hypothetical protein
MVFSLRVHTTRLAEGGEICLVKSVGGPRPNRRHGERRHGSARSIGVDPPAKKILHGEVLDGDKMLVDADQKELKFTVAGRSGDSLWKARHTTHLCSNKGLILDKAKPKG